MAGGNSGQVRSDFNAEFGMKARTPLRDDVRSRNVAGGLRGDTGAVKLLPRFARKWPSSSLGRPNTYVYRAEGSLKQKPSITCWVVPAACGDPESI